jgi:hypothetical protein
MGFVELGVGQPSRVLDHLAGQPDVVLDHAQEKVHLGHLRGSGKPQASRRVEVDGVRRGQADLAGLSAECSRRDAVRPG